MPEPTEREQTIGRDYHRIMAGKNVAKGKRNLDSAGVTLDEARGIYIKVRKFEAASN